LNLNAAALQVPIGLEDRHKGVVDLVLNKAYIFEGDRGEKVSSSNSCSTGKVVIFVVSEGIGGGSIAGGGWGGAGRRT